MSRQLKHAETPHAGADTTFSLRAANLMAWRSFGDDRQRVGKTRPILRRPGGRARPTVSPAPTTLRPNARPLYLLDCSAAFFSTARVPLSCPTRPMFPSWHAYSYIWGDVTPSTPPTIASSLV